MDLKDLLSFRSLTSNGEIKVTFPFGQWVSLRSTSLRNFKTITISIDDTLSIFFGGKDKDSCLILKGNRKFRVNHRED